MTLSGFRFDAAPTELMRICGYRGYKDFAPTELTGPSESHKGPQKRPHVRQASGQFEPGKLKTGCDGTPHQRPGSERFRGLPAEGWNDDLGTFILQ